MHPSEPVMSDSSPERLLAELRQQGIHDERVLAALGRVPRPEFVAAADQHRAYANVALPIGEGQTISQPYVVALMTQALALQPTERVLEIGTGSGYQAAVLAHLAASVISIERVPALADAARVRLAALGLANIEIHVGDGTLGWPVAAPYDAIVVTAAAPSVPPALVDQLDPGHGRLVIPVGDAEAQNLLLLQMRRGRRQARNLGPVRFVPLLGAHGWRHENGVGHH
jgi:protein-L-isoaspartate(D-aspartate) O-methyltransferase